MFSFLILGVFICEHKTIVRDNFKHIYAEEGRYYLPRKSLRSENGSSNPSQPNSAHTNEKMSLDARAANKRTSNNNFSNDKNSQNNKNTDYSSTKRKSDKEREAELNANQKQPNPNSQPKKKDGGCCVIS